LGDDLFQAERKLERRLLGPFSVGMILWAVLAAVQSDWWLAGICVRSAFAIGVVGTTLAKNRHKSIARLRLGSESDVPLPSIAPGATGTRWPSEDYRTLALDCHWFAFVVALTVIALCINLSVHGEGQSPGSQITWWIIVIAAIAAWFLATILAMFVSAYKRRAS
jgi:hypothetical protein